MADTNRPPDITEFLLARIAEDEAAATAATSASGVWDAFEVNYDHSRQQFATGVELIERTAAHDDTDGVLLAECDRFPGEFDDNGEVSLMGDTGLTWFAHIARWDPVRVHAECKAKRAIVEGMVPMGPIDDINLYEVLGLLATVYADHPDYRTDWVTL